MKRRYLWALVALVLVLAGLLAVTSACGGAAEGVTTSTTVSATTVTSNSPPTSAAETTTTAVPVTTATTAAAPAPVEGGTLEVALNEPSFIDPTTVYDSEGIQVAQALFDSLTQFDYVTNEVKPDVAESWDVNSDATQFTFHLKKGTKFQNGREVVAGDFKYAWERLSDPANEAAYQGLLSMVKGFDDFAADPKKAADIAGIKVVDDYTLHVDLASPYEDFPMVVAMVQCSPVPKEEVTKDPEAYARKPIGNGPFMMAEPWGDQTIKVVKFPDYTGTKPHIDGIDFKVYSDAATALTDFDAGNLDFAHLGSTTAQYQTAVAKNGKADDGGLTSNPGHQVFDGPEMTIFGLAFNCQNSLFKDNADLRQALSLAVNRQAIVDALYAGIRKPATSIVPEGVPGYEDGAAQYAKFDLEAAKAALAKAGYPNGQGLPTIILSYPSNADFGPLVELVQANFEALGIKVKLDGLAGPQYREKAGKGGEDFMVGLSTWTADYPAVDNFIFNLYGSQGAANFSHVSDPAIDKAVNDARTMADKAQALAAAQAAVKLIGDFCPDMPLFYYHHFEIGSSRVNNLTYSPMGFLDFGDCWLSAQ
jgi:oligopeptide transport system substrate-binding protein